MLAIDARLCLFHPRADEARVPPKQQTRLGECRQSGLITLDYPQPNRETGALRAVTKEIDHVLLMRSFFGDGIVRTLLRRVSRAKPTSAPLRF